MRPEITRPPPWVGLAGFEPATSCSQSKRATKLRYSPKTASRSMGNRTAFEVLRPVPVIPESYAFGMRPRVPQDLIDVADDWDDLHRWERSELGRALRRLGLTYGEIRGIIPVPKSTLSNWCREILLTGRQIDDIKTRSDPTSHTGIPVDTQWRRRRDVECLRGDAREFAFQHLTDAPFVAGVVLYLGEGSKTRNDLTRANSDPAANRIFISRIL